MRYVYDHRPRQRTEKDEEGSVSMNPTPIKDIIHAFTYKDNRCPGLASNTRYT
jgi:hypothetical protein